MPQIPPIDDAYIDDIIKSSGPYVEALNKTQGVKLRELVKKMRDYFEQEANGIVSITYADLVTLIAANGLKAGKQYLITDFQTTHNIVGSTPVVVATGTVEPIIVTAVTVNKLLPEAYSTIYTKDIITYSLDNTKLAGATKGVVLGRHDLERNVYLGYDFRTVLNRRYKLKPSTAWSAVGFSIKSVVSYNNGIYFCIQDHAGAQQPDTAVDYWVRLIRDNTGYLAPARANFSILGGSLGTLSIPVDFNDYQDVLTFPNYANVFNISLNEKNINSIPNIVVYTDGQAFSFSHNQFSSGTSAVTFNIRGGYYCYGNQFGVVANTILDCYSATANTNFQISQNRFNSLDRCIINVDLMYRNTIPMLTSCVLKGNFSYNVGTGLIQWCITPNKVETCTFNKFYGCIPIGLRTLQSTFFNLFVGVGPAGGGTTNSIVTLTADLFGKTLVGSHFGDSFPITTSFVLNELTTKDVVFLGLP